MSNTMKMVCAAAMLSLVLGVAGGVSAVSAQKSARAAAATRSAIAECVANTGLAPQECARQTRGTTSL